MDGKKGNTRIFQVIGLMSGTSLDGLDIAFCSFRYDGPSSEWSFQVHVAETIPYPAEWTERLSDLENSGAVEFARTDMDYGRWIGQAVIEFIHKHDVHADFIASHGHTIFHQPSGGFTTQIGKGAAIAAVAGLPVICDFRSADVALGGQGAPLVPIGDRLLFPQYEYCLNLGGFANISHEKAGQRIAYDICPANIILNRIALASGKAYDEDGRIAESGKIHEDLLEKLNSLEYYHLDPPKSLGKEWLMAHFIPVLQESGIPAEDKMRTVVEHIAQRVAQSLGDDPLKQALVTGGGALNRFLVAQIRDKTTTRIVIPEIRIIQFKEALIFAFLGVLRWMGETNTLCSVTGATRDSSGGCIYL